MNKKESELTNLIIKDLDTELSKMCPLPGVVYLDKRYYIKESDRFDQYYVKNKIVDFLNVERDMDCSIVINRNEDSIDVTIKVFSRDDF